MPRNKDLKRLTRSRMQKTGEAYTAARAQLLKKKKTSPPEAPVPPAAEPDYAALAGMSDETVRAKTGCTWKRWVWALDKAGAASWSHREIANHVHEKYRIPGWWAQTVTVGYERIKGLRAIGQRRGGGFEASKSKTLPVPVGTLFRAFHDARTRARWLPGARLTVRTATPGKSMRVTWEDGTSVELYFAAKGEAKSQVAVQHRKLAAKADVDRMKRFWGERLEALAGVLALPGE